MELTDKREQLLADGFCLVPKVVGPDFIERLKEASDQLVRAMTKEQREAQRSTGSMIGVCWRNPIFGELATGSEIRGVMENLRLDDTRFSCGFVISKPPQSPPLFWHYDWAAWDHPYSYGNVPAQIFLMFYLVDTAQANGCLRVIPKSHIEDHPLHDVIQLPHAEDLQRAKDLSRAEFQSHPDSVDVPVKAGDLVIGDSRILHGAHANQSGERRTVITLWYHPAFESVPEPIQGFIAGMYQPPPEEWSDGLRRRLEAMSPAYHGCARPVQFSRERMSRAIFFANS